MTKQPEPRFLYLHAAEQAEEFLREYVSAVNNPGGKSNDAASN